MGPKTEDVWTDILSTPKTNHGIAVSSDGRTLYASSAEEVYSWSYDGATASVTGPNATIVNGMTGTDVRRSVQDFLRMTDYC